MFWLQKLAALSAAIAIAAGAFGAHRFIGKEAEWLRTGGLYQLTHAIAVLALIRVAAPGALWTLLGGATLSPHRCMRWRSGRRAGSAR